MEWLSRILENKSARTGELCDNDFTRLRQEVLGELNRSFTDHISRRSLAFCFPEPPIVYPQSAGESESLWETGATVTIQQLEAVNGHLLALCRHASSRLDRLVTCSLYLSRPSGISFSWHTDEWDGLIFQIRGVKRFSIKTICEVTDFELIPRTWLRLASTDVHRAQSTDLSVHLSVNILHRPCSVSRTAAL